MSLSTRCCFPLKESTVKLLQRLALEQDDSLTDLTSQVIMGCLTQEPGEGPRKTKTFDTEVVALDVQMIGDLEKRAEGAIEAGLVWPISEWDNVSSTYKAGKGIFYLPCGLRGNSAILAGCDDDITTYGGRMYSSVLKSVDAFLEWGWDFYGKPCPYGLCVTPKGVDPDDAARGEVYDWDGPMRQPRP